MIKAQAACVRVLVGCGLAAMLLGCASSSGQGPSSALASGIEGSTVVGPECPVIRAASPCPDRPLQARLAVMAAGSTVPVAMVLTDSAGHFRIPLVPGRYTVQPSNLTRATFPIARPVTVTVAEGRFTGLTISFDSGIR